MERLNSLSTHPFLLLSTSREDSDNEDIPLSRVKELLEAAYHPVAARITVNLTINDSDDDSQDDLPLRNSWSQVIVNLPSYRPLLFMPWPYPELYPYTHQGDVQKTQDRSTAVIPYRHKKDSINAQKSVTLAMKCIVPNCPFEWHDHIASL